MTRTPSAVISPTGTPHPFGGVFAMLAPHMAALDQFLLGQLAAFEPEIRAMVNYCIDTSGKRIRPALVFLSGWRDADEVSPELVRAAVVVELVHLATGPCQAARPGNRIFQARYVFGRTDVGEGHAQEFFAAIAVMGHGRMIRLQEAQGFPVEHPHWQGVVLEQQPELHALLL